MSSEFDISINPVFRVINGISGFACILTFIRLFKQNSLSTAMQLFAISYFILNLSTPFIGLSNCACLIVGFLNTLLAWTSLSSCSTFYTYLGRSKSNIELKEDGLLQRNCRESSISSVRLRKTLRIT